MKRENRPRVSTNLYLTSRMLFSLSRGNYAPRSLGNLSKNGTPVNAIIVSSGGVLVASLVSYLSPMAFNYLFGVALFGGILVWIIILVSHLNFRKSVHLHHPGPLPIRAPLFPVLQWIGIILLSAILITMAFSPDFQVAWIVGVPFIVIISIAFLLRRKSLQATTNQNLKL